MNIRLLSRKEWLVWFKSTPITLRIFLVLILSRPIIDATYIFKDEGILSPMQLVGAFQFLFFSSMLILKRNKLWSGNIMTGLFSVFSIILLINAFLVSTNNNIFGFISSFFKIGTPIVAFFYLRNEIRSIRDVNGILNTFLISAIIPYTIFLFEFFVQPIRVVEMSDSRGGGLRLSGFYADIFNYMCYIIGTYIILVSFIVEKKYHGYSVKLFKYILILLLTFTGMLGINHQASWGVFVVLILITFIQLRAFKLGKQIAVLMVVSIFFAGGILWEDTISKLFAKEIAAYEGRADADRMMNGRIIRWKMYFNYWKVIPVTYQLLGVGGHKPSESAYNVTFRGTVTSSISQIMMSGGMHSDYVRIFFSTGIFGSLLYLFFQLSVVNRILKHPKKIRFLLFGGWIVLILYGVSANPLLSSAGLMYFYITVLVLISLPLNFYIHERK
jgi:hypothetical protein